MITTLTTNTAGGGTAAEVLRGELLLGIESSCDETAAALVDRTGHVRASLVASQVELHARYGGVVPEEAARAHIQACLPLVKELLAMGVDGKPTPWDQIAGVAVTYGPGLIGCLLVGLETAKALAWRHEKPLIGVHHLAAHLHAIHLVPPEGAHLLAEAGELHPFVPGGELAAPGWPHIGLIVSGGHTSLVRVEAPGELTTLARTRDDAAGEAYDKVARVAGLGYPGGPIIDRLAAEGDAKRYPFPVPMTRPDQPDFSFSGLKTGAGREAERLRTAHGGSIPEGELRDLCAGFQRAAVTGLIEKSIDAAAAAGLRDLVIAGGVACNRGLRECAREATGSRFARKRGLRVWFPHPGLCTDNAAMIAGLGWRLPPLDRDAGLALNAYAQLDL